MGTKLDQCSTTMIWSSKINNRCWNIVYWKVITWPKILGGLDVRDACTTNISLLVNLIWHIMHSADKYQVQILSSKYLQNDAILTAKLKPRDSYVWWSVIQAKDVLLDGFSSQLGDGQSFWYSNQLADGKLCMKVSYVHESSVCCIEQIVVPSNPVRDDIIFWKGHSSCVYSSKSNYNKVSKFDDVPQDLAWCRIWHAPLLEKLHFFLWKNRENVRKNTHLLTVKKCYEKHTPLHYS